MRLVNYGANLKSECLDPRAGSFTLLQWFANCVPWSPAGTVLGCGCWEAPRKQCSVPRLSQPGCQAIVNLLDQASLEVFPQGSISQWGEPSRLLKAVYQLSSKLVVCVCVYARSCQSCLTLCHLMDCSPPGFSVRGILQARILEWVARPSSRGSSQSRD